MPTTRDTSTFPGMGLTCHLIAGATLENPELPGALMFAKYVGRASNSSRQEATPRRHRVFVPSTNRPPSRALKFNPFSLCRLPIGTTRLEFVTSGRSVAIWSLAVGQASARASTAASIVQAHSRHVRRVGLVMKTLIGKTRGAAAWQEIGIQPIASSARAKNLGFCWNISRHLRSAIAHPRRLAGQAKRAMPTGRADARPTMNSSNKQGGLLSQAAHPDSNALIEIRWARRRSAFAH